MAGFKTHITVSTLVGIGFGGAAYALFDVPAPTCILAGGLCGVSGMLPDIDSGPGVPLRESLAFGAAVVSTLLASRLLQFDVARETVVLAAAITYLLVRFGLAELLKRYTVHRGMFHSIPAAIIFGELAFLLSTGELEMRYYKAGAVVLGYLSHLVLDELYSLQLHRGRLAPKKSFGTAVKLIGRGWWPNVSTYAKLALLTFVVMQEPGWMKDYLQQHGATDRVEQTASQMVDRFLR
jgi:membrane-bound metal-dependent hydrolase YbcI (DUF457 family)